MEVIHFYHTNDIHSHVERWPRIQHFIQKQRQLHEQANEEVFVLDIGDHVDRFHPHTEATLGKSNVELLNQLGIDFATIGNNEGITLPHDGLDSLYDQAQFQVLVANLYDQNGSRPYWLKPYQITQTRHGTKIAFIGLTVFFSAFYKELGWQLTEPFKELENCLQAVKGEADIIVVLSHLGIHEDEEMARTFPEIDVILGGHTHHVLPEGRMINGVLLACAGKYGQYAGYVEVKVDTNQNANISKEATLYNTDDLPKVLGEESWVQTWWQIGADFLKEKVTDIPDDLQISWKHPSPLAELLADGLKKWNDAEASFLNSGVILRSLTKGPVTKLDMLEILPHPINPCVVWLRGSELYEIIRYSQDTKWSDHPVKGLGFRGEVMGCFVYSGIQLNYENKEMTLWINNKEVDPDKVYKIATLDMFTFGRYFPEIVRAEKKNYHMSHMLRDVMAWKLIQTYRKV